MGHQAQLGPQNRPPAPALAQTAGLKRSAVRRAARGRDGGDGGGNDPIAARGKIRRWNASLQLAPSMTKASGVGPIRSCSSSSHPLDSVAIERAQSAVFSPEFR